jgi:osmotically-inducible protein OsmY
MLTAACVTTVPKSPQQSAADAALANRVYLALNADPWFYFRHVDVRVDGGVADLSGYVWSADALYRARHIASTVPGVTRVVTSNLDLERNGLSNGVSSR